MKQMLDHASNKTQATRVLPAASPTYAKATKWIDQHVDSLTRDMPKGYVPPRFGSLDWWRLVGEQKDDLAMAAVYLAALAWLAEGETLPEQLRQELDRERAAYEQGYNDGWESWEFQLSKPPRKLRVIK